MPSIDHIDWTRATVKVTVPVQHTAMETVQEIDIPLVHLSAALREIGPPKSET